MEIIKIVFPVLLIGVLAVFVVYTAKKQTKNRMETENSQKSDTYIVEGMVLGMLFGTAIGIILHNMLFGLFFGLLSGMIVGINRTK